MATNREATVKDASAMTFLSNVDCRQVTVFCLGWVFMFSLNCIISSAFIRSVFARLIGHPSRTSADAETKSEKSFDSASSLHLNAGQRQDYQSLTFLLSLCFASASVTHFASLCSFPSNAGPACAFVVAWGSITSQAARLVGALILVFELRSLGISWWEYGPCLGSLSVAMVFVVVSCGIGVGNLMRVDTLGINVCHRNLFLPGALTASLIFIILEIYVIGRFYSLLAPPFLQLSHRVSIFKDLRLIRGGTLLILELLTVVPSAIYTNIMAEFIPFTLGALLVLAAFNSPLHSENSSAVNSIPPTITVPASYPPSALDIAGSQRSSRRATMAIANRSIIPPTLPYHPYSAQYDNGASMEERDWSEDNHFRRNSGHRTARSSFYLRSARSSKTFDTTTSGSAVVHYAQRAKHPFGSEVNPFPDLLTFPEPNLSQGISGVQTPKALLLSRPVVPSQEDLLEKVNMETTVTPRVMARPRLMVVTSSTSKADSDVQPDSSILPLMTALKTTPTDHDEPFSPSLTSIATAHRKSGQSLSRSTSSWVNSLKRAPTSNPGHPPNLWPISSQESAVPEQESAVMTPRLPLSPQTRADQRQSSFTSSTHGTSTISEAYTSGENVAVSSYDTHDEDVRVHTLSRMPTFGGGGRSQQYRAIGYANPIQSRWSSSNSTPARSPTTPEAQTAVVGPPPLPLPPLISGTPCVPEEEASASPVRS